MQTELLYKKFKENYLITTDSRNIIKDSIFFALKGDNFDGNKYAEKAIKNGARLAVIDDKNYKKDNRFILVNDVLKSLQLLSNYHRNKVNCTIIAITGTNGKTTSKELIASCLKKKYKIYATKGNLNNHIGVPLTLLSIKEDTEFAVVEMGASSINEIDALCKIAEPDFGAITNIGKAHILGFGSFENIIKAKTELYKYLDKNKKTI